MARNAFAPGVVVVPNPDARLRQTSGPATTPDAFTRLVVLAVSADQLEVVTLGGGPRFIAHPNDLTQVAV